MVQIYLRNSTTHRCKYRKSRYILRKQANIKLHMCCTYIFLYITINSIGTHTAIMCYIFLYLNTPYDATSHYIKLHNTILTTLYNITLSECHSLHYTTLHYTTLHYTTLHYTTLHYTHYTHYITLHHTTHYTYYTHYIHYTTLQKQFKSKI